MLLSIDTSSKNCSVSVANKGQIVCSLYFYGLTTSSSILPNVVSQCLSICNLKFEDIDEIGVVDGPGSFTGLRIGFSYAQGIAASTDFKIKRYSVSKLLLPSVFINKFYPDLTSFYHILQIKKNHHIGAKIDMINIEKSEIFGYEEKIEKYSSDFDESIPIISDSALAGIANTRIPYYEFFGDISATLAQFIHTHNPHQIEGGQFFPKYYKQSEAEINKLLL